MKEPYCFSNGNFQQICDSAVGFIERYSRDNLLNLSKKRLLSTQSDGLNDLLDGGFYTQEIAEIVGDSHVHNAQLILHTLVHLLYTNKDTEAVIISSNGSQNEEVIYRIVHRYIESQKSVIPLTDSVDADDIAFGIMKRIYIINCVELNELLMILDEIMKGRHKKQRKTSSTSPLPRLSGRPDPLMNKEERGLFIAPLAGEDSTNCPPMPDQASDTHLRMVFIHLLSSMVEDSQAKDAWEKMPSICMKLRTVAVKLNVAMMITNYHDEEANAGYSSVEDKDDGFGGIPRAVNWVMASSKWNSTVDKRIEVTLNQPDWDTSRVNVTLNLVKSKYSGVPRSCHLFLTENQMVDDHV